MKLMRSELRLDAAAVPPPSQRSGGLLRSCGGNHGNVSSSSRLPFSVISTNTLRCGGGTTTNSAVTSLRLKTSRVALKLHPQPTTTTTSSPPPLSRCENDSRFYQTASEDVDAAPDVWTVIKPGHVREKIAIFASEGGAKGSELTTSSPPSPPATNAAVSGLSRAAKAKGSWEETGRAKRRRRSGGNANQNQNQNQNPVLDSLQHDARLRRSDSAQRPGARRSGEAVAPAPAEEEEAEEEQKVSVVEMVAFLEQRASEQQLDCKPSLALQRGGGGGGGEVRGEEPDGVRVSDMVARLEGACLRRRADGGLSLSRSNSLRRSVGRVLLAAAAAADCSTALTSPVTSSLTSSLTSSVTSPGAQSPGREPISCSDTPPGEVVVAATPPQREEAEPVPGLLFLSELRPLRHRTTLHLRPAPSLPAAVSSSPDLDGQSEKRRSGPGPEAAAVSRRASASQDFLSMRQRLQQLLEPTPYLSLLPLHLLLAVLRLLPTQSLAALKCTCRYFRFVIEDYGVRPADSLWVSDPRYRDDPCKQCKRRYGRGDVSLCRWHHKPFCQALPYGPGYWMCCHGASRDTPGCNVGLHDNRWVPAFHSINVPIYRRSHDDD